MQRMANYDAMSVDAYDAMAVDAYDAMAVVPGIVQPQQSQMLEMQYVAWQFDAHFLE